MDNINNWTDVLKFSPWYGGDVFDIAKRMSLWLGLCIESDKDCVKRDGDNNIVQYSGGVIFATNERLAFHELGHWLVAPSSRRKLENYGLGCDPDFGGETVVPIVSYEFMDTEEYRADILGGMMYHFAGGDLLRDYARPHSWDIEYPRMDIDFCSGLEWLIKNGHLTTNLVPVKFYEFIGGRYDQVI